MNLQPDRPPGASDFDFLFGAWTVHNRRLVERLKGCTKWEEFGATYEARPLLGGMANLDELHAERDGVRFEGVSLRVFNPEDRSWKIYWVDNHGLTLREPVAGTFRDGVGTFFCEEPFEDRIVKVRFLWSVVDEDHARWEQAFSDDGGRTWETNWTMTFTRVA